MNIETGEKMPLYAGIVADYTEKIQKKELLPGEQLLSVANMCEHYNVSDITARRAITELKKMGLVSSVKGKGCFVNESVGQMPETNGKPKDIKRVVLLTSNASILTRKKSFWAEIANEIGSYVSEKGIGFNVEFLPGGSRIFQTNFSLDLKPDDALIILTNRIAPQLISAIQDKLSRCIWIDSVCFFTNCCLTDNFGGMSKLMTHLIEKGHKKILLACQNPISANQSNENERITAFRNLIEFNNIEGEIICADDFSNIANKIKGKGSPSAVMFTQDDPAVDFIKYLQGKGVSVPQDISITGFDGWLQREDEVAELTTCRVALEGLARSAVDFITRNDYWDINGNSWVRVPGEFIEGTTVSEINNI
ncbi:MAG: substrate-binding domain-containing protein [Planctomycetota bacterium]|jgi:DNA-binding LacI/PurR family transcriptional regulator